MLKTISKLQVGAVKTLCHIHQILIQCLCLLAVYNCHFLLQITVILIII